MLSRDYGLLPHVLAEQMLAAEEAALMAAYKKQPWGDQRLEVSLAQIAQILWNVNSKKEHHKKLADFLPFYKPPVVHDPDVENKIRRIFGKLTGRKT